MSLSLCICSKKWLLTLGSWVTSYKGTYPGKIDSLGYHTPVWLTRSQEYDNLRRLIHREEIIRKCWPFDSSRFHLLLRKTHQGITPWGDRFNGESYPVESGLVRIFLLLRVLLYSISGESTVGLICKLFNFGSGSTFFSPALTPCSSISSPILPLYYILLYQ